MKLVIPPDLLTAHSPLPIEVVRFIGICEMADARGMIVPDLLRIQTRLTGLVAAGLVVLMICATVLTRIFISPHIVMTLVPFTLGMLLHSLATADGAWRRSARARAVVGNDLFEHRSERAGVDSFTLTHGHRPRAFVVESGGYYSLWIGDNRSVVEENLDVVLRRLQRTDVAVQHEVRTIRAFDHFGNIRIGRHVTSAACPTVRASRIAEPVWQ